MDASNSLAVQAWTERRDDILAQAFAEGLSDEDVLAITEREHFDLSPEAIAEKRGELYERVIAIMSTEGPKVLRRIRHMHLSYRMQQVEMWLLKASKGIAWAADTDHWSLVPKLMDASLKAMRYMKEEADGIRHVGYDEDRQRAQRMARLTPEQRERIQTHISYIQTIVDSEVASESEVVSIEDIPCEEGSDGPG